MIRRSKRIEKKRNWAMLTITTDDLGGILRDYGVTSTCRGFTELQRYDYEDYDPTGKSVRLIIKAETEDGRAFAVRLKNEEDVTPEIVEAQSGFAAALRARGIETPRVFSSNGRYARQYAIHGYEVTVTVEEFVPRQLQTVDAEAAEKTGRLLAHMHNIAEEDDLHVENEVLFDPLTWNDLFCFEEFTKHEAFLNDIDSGLYEAIVLEHEKHEKKLRDLTEPRYAVQGDISDCNLYVTESGELGVFDFNRSGDNVLFFDAVMQAVFEARLMDYPDEISKDPEPVILPAFLRGYTDVRPFSKAQRECFPCLFALISAFWLVDLRYGDASLRAAAEENDREAARKCMETILAKLRGAKSVLQTARDLI